MQWAEVYRQRGLGAMVRQLWQKEHVSPPAELNNGQVWEWLNRSDVATSVMFQLVPDTRLCLVAVAGMVQRVACFVGPPWTDVLRTAQLAVYGVEIDGWREQVQRAHKARAALEPTEAWPTAAVACTCGVLNATQMLLQGAPTQVARRELYNAAETVWWALRTKLRDTDGFPDVSAKTLANQILLGELRDVIHPSLFTAVYVEARGS